LLGLRLCRAACRAGSWPEGASAIGLATALERRDTKASGKIEIIAAKARPELDVPRSDTESAKGYGLDRLLRELVLTELSPQDGSEASIYSHRPSN
jgi:hypothetical protein